LNFHDQIEKTNKVYDKFRNIQNLVLSMAVLRGKYTEISTSPALDEYKHQITKEEFLDFTPTPKNKDIESFGLLEKQLSSDSEISK